MYPPKCKYQINSRHYNLPNEIKSFTNTMNLTSPNLNFGPPLTSEQNRPARNKILACCVKLHPDSKLVCHKLVAKKLNLCNPSSLLLTPFTYLRVRFFYICKLLLNGNRAVAKLRVHSLAHGQPVYFKIYI